MGYTKNYPDPYIKRIKTYDNEPFTTGQVAEFAVWPRNYGEKDARNCKVIISGENINTYTLEAGTLDSGDIIKLPVDIIGYKPGTFKLKFEVVCDGESSKYKADNIEYETYTWIGEDMSHMLNSNSGNLNYEFDEYTIGNINGRFQVKEIITDLDNIEVEEINEPLEDTSYVGVNGGFFEADNGYDQSPTRGDSISYNDGDCHCKYNRNSSDLVERKTMIIYKDNGEITADYRYVKEIDEVFDEFGKNNVLQVIGGTDYSRSNHTSKSYYGPTGRTVVAWRKNKAHLIVIEGGVQDKYGGINIPDLKDLIDDIGLDPRDSIVLDGSASTSMQVKDINGRWRNFGGDRHVFNAVKLDRKYK